MLSAAAAAAGATRLYKVCVEFVVLNTQFVLCCFCCFARAVSDKKCLSEHLKRNKWHHVSYMWAPSSALYGNLSESAWMLPHPLRDACCNSLVLTAASILMAYVHFFPNKGNLFPSGFNFFQDSRKSSICFQDSRKSSKFFSSGSIFFRSWVKWLV